MEDFVIKTLVVGQLQTNCYLIIDKKVKKALIIDPGDDADYIIRILADEKVTPLKIIATHGHFDHILGVTELKLNFNIPFLINQKDLFLVKDMVKRTKYYLPDVTPIPPNIDKFLVNDEVIDFGNNQIRIIETPGHTPGSICLYSAKQNILFSGDTIFAGGGVGRTDFSYSSSIDLQKSLKKIFKLPGITTIYPGHGETSTIKQEYEFFRKGLP